MLAVVPNWLVILIVFTAGFLLRPVIVKIFKNPEIIFDWEDKDND